LTFCPTHFVEANDAFNAPFVSLVMTSAYPALIWWTFILVGLGVGRCDLAVTGVRIGLLAAGAGLAVLGYGGGWLSTQWWSGGGRSTETAYLSARVPGTRSR
jgi:hypothetical protein